MHRLKTRNGIKPKRSTCPYLADILHLSQEILICNDDGKKKILQENIGKKIKDLSIKYSLSLSQSMVPDSPTRLIFNPICV